MALNYPKDWFPFPLVDDSKATGPNATLPTLDFSSAQMALLTKVFWMAKSYDWSVNLAWSYDAVDSSDPTNVIEEREAGSIIGSGTILIETPQTAPRATGALPGERVYFEGLFPFSGNQFFPVEPSTALACICNSSGSLTVNGVNQPGSPQNYSGPPNSPPVLGWMGAVETSVYPAMCFVTKNGAGFRTRLQVNAAADGTTSLGQACPLTNANVTGWSPSAVTSTITIDGVAVIVPMYQLTPTVDLPATLAYSLTGSISLDFNRFWTP